jgi:DNA-binding response OmpR family regulator
MTNHVLTGKRILLAEDFFSLAEMVRLMLENLGCVVVGPVPSIQKAIPLIETERLDAALLDVSLKDGKVFPVAEKLQACGVPFVFATAYDDEWAIPPEYRGAPRVVKPFSEDDLSSAMCALFAATRPAETDREAV